MLRSGERNRTSPDVTDVRSQRVTLEHLAHFQTTLGLERKDKRTIHDKSDFDAVWMIKKTSWFISMTFL